MKYVWGLAALLVAVVPGNALNGQPHVTPWSEKQVGKNQGARNASDQQPEADHKPDPKAPPPGADLSAPKREDPAIPAKAEHPKDEPKWTDRAQAESAVVVAVLTVALIGITAVQTRLITRSTAAAERAARAAERALTELERAFVFASVELERADGFEIVGRSGDESVCAIPYKIKFVNHGNTPAIIRRIRFHTVISHTCPTEVDDGIKTFGKIPDGLVIGPSKKRVYRDVMRNHAKEWRAITALEASLYVVGAIEYDDVFGSRRLTEFCWRFIHRKGCSEFYIADGSPLNRRT